MKRIYLTALTLAAVSLLAAGCGSGSKGASSASSPEQPSTKGGGTASPTALHTAPGSVKLAVGRPLSRAEWIAKGDAICSRINAQRAAQKVATAADVARVFPQIALYDKLEATELSKLVPPSSKTQDWKQIVEGLLLFGEYAARVAEYAQANNVNAAKPLIAQGEKTNERLQAIAGRDGFKHCSSN